MPRFKITFENVTSFDEFDLSQFDEKEGLENIEICLKQDGILSVSMEGIVNTQEKLVEFSSQSIKELLDWRSRVGIY